jgi:hypothetical protein
VEQYVTDYEGAIAWTAAVDSTVGDRGEAAGSLAAYLIGELDSERV